MFPGLQVIKVKDLSDVGHYFLLVLNIRNTRFEVLDSMRTLEDTNLRTCCDKLLESIKNLWSEHYSDSKVQIQNYEAISISVPLKKNKYKYPFHFFFSALAKTCTRLGTSVADLGNFFCVLQP
jgi:hypothetical protein